MYPNGIPIIAEADLDSFVKKHKVKHIIEIGVREEQRINKIVAGQGSCFLVQRCAAHRCKLYIYYFQQLLNVFPPAHSKLWLQRTLLVKY